MGRGADLGEEAGFGDGPKRQTQRKILTSNRFPTERPRNLDFGSNIVVLGSGRGSNGRGAPVGFIWTEFQLKRSHGDPFHAQNNRLCATGSNSGAPGS